ncbi:MAG TPA: hypothetical protein VGR24_06835 [bacterium]|jgi:hypothetical protein|nr:hypothetical protein [bacterium]
MILTIFGAPKPFRGAAAAAQWNAIMSWASLRPRPQIILMGDAEGADQMSRDIGALHVPDVARNEFGTPLVSSLFTLAAAHAEHAVVCYANADVMFTDTLPRAAQTAAGRWDSFLLTGRRYDVPLGGRWEFGDPHWQSALDALARHRGRLDPWIAADYFVFPRGQFTDVPPFALGRTVWDNWLIYAARAARIAVVDATAAVLAVHQRHDYSHHRGGREGVWEGREAQRNRALAGGVDHAFCVADATHVLTRSGRLWPAIRPVYLWRRAYAWPVFQPRARVVRGVLQAVLAMSRPLRRRMGWTLGPR